MSLMGRLGRIMVENSAWEKERCWGQNTLLEPPTTTKKKSKTKATTFFLSCGLDSRRPGSSSTKILLSLSSFVFELPPTPLPKPTDSRPLPQQIFSIRTRAEKKCRALSPIRFSSRTQQPSNCFN